MRLNWLLSRGLNCKFYTALFVFYSNLDFQLLLRRRLDSYIPKISFGIILIFKYLQTGWIWTGDDWKDKPHILWVRHFHVVYNDANRWLNSVSFSPSHSNSFISKGIYRSKKKNHKFSTFMMAKFSELLSISF